MSLLEVDDSVDDLQIFVNRPDDTYPPDPDLLARQARPSSAFFFPKIPSFFVARRLP